MWGRMGTRISVCTGSRDKSGFKLWDVVTGANIAVLPGSTNQESVGVAFSPDGKRLATVSAIYYNNSIPAEVKIWDVALRRPLMSMPGLKTFAVHADFSPDGQFLATVGGCI